MVTDRSTFQVGDAARSSLEEHDVVLLNRVLCCYPEVDALLENSLRAARHVFAFTAPPSSGMAGIFARVETGLANMTSGSATGSSRASASTCTILLRSIDGYTRPGSDRPSNVVAAWSGDSPSTNGLDDGEPLLTGR